MEGADILRETLVTVSVRVPGSVRVWIARTTVSPILVLLGSTRLKQPLQMLVVFPVKSPGVTVLHEGDRSTSPRICSRCK